MNYNESVRYLLTLGRELASPQQALAAKFDLHNIREICERMGHPERQFGSVHIAGTNGKGSTAAMLASIIQAAGLRCGLYTSPHLVRINERIRLDGADISDEEFAESFTRVLAIVGSCWLPERSPPIPRTSNALRPWLSTSSPAPAWKLRLSR